ncbi:MAG: DNA-binding transcriptional ArsR family regulator [Planctomycetota bacterium]
MTIIVNASLSGDMTATDANLVWKALADPTRRELLDVLAVKPRTTGELVEKFPDLCRTGVMKHLDLLVEAHLVLVRREGRVRWNQLNPMPIQLIYDRFVSKHVRGMAGAVSRLKSRAEQPGGKTSKREQKAGRKSTAVTRKSK